jgi:hypothetical protein
VTAQTAATLKGYFNSGDIPTEGNFADLVDSLPTDTNVQAYGAVGDGSHDDTAAIQAAIDACAAGGVVYIPIGLYKITAALSCTTNLTLRGAGASVIYGAVAVDYATYPAAAPWVTGSVLLQSTPATNGINITGTGVNVSIENIAIRFADAIAFNNTGHGVYAVPTATSGSGHNNGTLSATWRNVIVFGHDGNHYAFYNVNSVYLLAEHLQGFGGGGWYQECDSYATNYGNTVINDTYFLLMAGGTADGFHIKSRTTTYPGVLNMLTFIRPQCNVALASVTLSAVFTFSPVTAAQYRWKDEGDPTAVYVIAPDLECPVGIPCPVSFGAKTYISPEGSFLSETSGVRVAFRRKKPYDGLPTLSFGGGAGTVGTPTGSVLQVYSLAPNDERGKVRFIPSAGPMAANGDRVVRVTLESWNGIGAVFIQPTPYEPNEFASVGAQFYPYNVTTNSFEVWANTQLTEGVKYAFMYLVLE